MWSFILKTILKRALPIPVMWGALYPTVTGSIVARNAVLFAPALEEGAEARPLVTVRYARLEPEWGTARKPVIRIVKAELDGIDAVLDLAQPAQIINCLQNHHCLPPRALAKLRGRLKSKARIPGQPEEQAEEQDSESENLKPLAFEVAQIEITDSRINLVRGDQRFELKIFNGGGGPISIPLGNSQFELRADALLKTPEQSEVPLRVLVRWASDTERLQVALSLKNFPMGLFDQLFPELQSKAVAAASASGVSGTLSGEISLTYDASDASSGKWSLR